MINDHPDARSLVEQALADFRAHILPLVPKDQRLTGLMIANALGIAARELAAGGDADRRAAARADALLAGIGETTDGGGAPAASLTRLATAITEGRLDGPEQAGELRSILRDLTVARVGISNPKMLAQS